MLGVVLAIAAATGIVIFVLWLPRYLVDSRHLSLNAKDQFDAEAGIRSSLLQFVGGAVLVSGLYFTARGFYDV